MTVGLNERLTVGPCEVISGTMECPHNGGSVKQSGPTTIYNDASRRFSFFFFIILLRIRGEKSRYRRKENSVSPLDGFIPRNDKPSNPRSAVSFFSFRYLKLYRADPVPGDFYLLPHQENGTIRTMAVQCDLRYIYPIVTLKKKP